MTLKEKVAWIVWDEILHPVYRNISKEIAPIGEHQYIRNGKAREIQRNALYEFGRLPIDMNLELQNMAERLMEQLQANVTLDEFETWKNDQDDSKPDWDEDFWKEVNDIPTIAVKVG